MSRNKYGIYCSILKKDGGLCSAADRSMEQCGGKEGTLETTACYVLAPAITAFLCWMLKRAQQIGIKRLYFLARDGYFMYHGAVMLCKRYGISMDCRYLECSRYSLRLPAYHKDHEAALDFICRGGIDVTLHKILLRAGLTEDEAELIANQMEAAKEFDEVMNYTQTRRLIGVLGKNNSFLQLMDEHSRKAYDNAIGYLKQEGLMDEELYGVVDSGWTGSMQNVLQNLTRHQGRKNRIHGFYWGLYELPAGTYEADYDTFYFSPWKHIGRKTAFSNCLFECIFSAPGGMTVRYARGEVYYPVHGATKVHNYDVLNRLEVCFQSYWDCFMESVQNPESVSGEKCRRIIARLMSRFMMHPSLEEAELFGGLLFSDDILDNHMQRVAAPLGQEELGSNHLLTRLLIMTGHSKRKLKESAWYEGSAVLCGRGADAHIAQYALYKYFVYLRKWWKNR